MLKNESSLIDFYIDARSFVIKNGYSDEVCWQRDIINKDFSETEFLRESAWVILNSGMREQVIRKHFDYISFCFFDWESSKKITHDYSNCISFAVKKFNNHKKIMAIAEISKIIDSVGFNNFKSKIISDPITVLEGLPYIGSVTSYHLAKNIGIDIAKPDRHLTRLSSFFGYSSVQKFCLDISRETSDPISVVDLICWRYLNLVN